MEIINNVKTQTTTVSDVRTLDQCEWKNIFN